MWSHDLGGSNPWDGQIHEIHRKKIEFWGVHGRSGNLLKVTIETAYSH